MQYFNLKERNRAVVCNGQLPSMEIKEYGAYEGKIFTSIYGRRKADSGK